MSFLTAVRRRGSTPEPGSDAVRSGDPQPHPDAEAALPFAGYDRLATRQVIDGLSDHSQIELKAVEAYERSHKNREPVLNKLRWMRGAEPMPGYDALSAEEVVTALGEADLPTIRRVRGYERKFANRAIVLDEVVRVHHQRLAAQPATPAPAYQPLSATGSAAV